MDSECGFITIEKDGGCFGKTGFFFSFVPGSVDFLKAAADFVIVKV